VGERKNLCPSRCGRDAPAVRVRVSRFGRYAAVASSAGRYSPIAIDAPSASLKSLEILLRVGKRLRRGGGFSTRRQGFFSPLSSLFLRVCCFLFEGTRPLREVSFFGSKSSYLFPCLPDRLLSLFALRRLLAMWRRRPPLFSPGSANVGGETGQRLKARRLQVLGQPSTLEQLPPIFGERCSP
jgi:hypothetical protein